MNISHWHNPLAWTVKAIQEAELRERPYAHLVVDDVFPPWYYREMLAMSPAPDEGGAFKDSWRQFDLVPDPGVAKAVEGDWLAGLRIEDHRAAFWRSFREAYLSSDALHFATADRFYHIFRRCGLQWSSDHSSITVGRLAYDGLGAGLGPHTDRADKKVSMVFYLADESHDNDECREGMGTQVCRSVDPEFTPDPNRHYTWEQYESAGTVEYVPNRLICWPVTPDSVHAYHQTVDQWRRSLKVFVQVPEDPAVVQARIADSQKHADEWRKTT